jgi:hypothetical protein
MKRRGLFFWVAIAAASFGLLLLILSVTGVAPADLPYTVVAGLAVVAMIAASLDRTERR